MSKVGEIGSSQVNWNALADKIDAKDYKTRDDGHKGLSMSENTFDRGVSFQGTIPQLDFPVMDDSSQDALKSLVEKIGTDSAFILSDENMALLGSKVGNLVESTLTAAGSATEKAGDAGTVSAATVKKNINNTMFNIYELLALLVECAQEQKNAERELRLADNLAVQHSIQCQADAQKSSALTGLIAGSVVCAIQVATTTYSMVKTISNIKAESALSQTHNVNQAASNYTEARTQLQNDIDALNTFEKNNAPQGNVDGIEMQTQEQMQQISQQRTELTDKVNASRENLAAKQGELDAARNSMQSDANYAKLQASQAKMRAVSEMSMAIGNLGQTIVRGFMDLSSANATAIGAEQKKSEEQLEQTKDLMASFQAVIDQLSQLCMAVLSAESQSMQDAIHA